MRTTFFLCTLLPSLAVAFTTTSHAFVGKRTSAAESTTSLFAEANGAEPKKVIVLGGDGFCGWPTSLYLSDQGHDVVIVDNLSRRKIDLELGCDSLTPIQSPEVSVCCVMLSVVPRVLCPNCRLATFCCCWCFVRFRCVGLGPICTESCRIRQLRRSIFVLCRPLACRSGFVSLGSSML